MIGKIDPKIKKATVIGGGISGLLIAYELDRRGYEVELFEKSDRLGGLISTRKHPEGIAEAAAHSLLVTESVRHLANELGIQLFPLKKRQKARWIARDGRLRKFPLGLLELIEVFFRLLFIPSLIRGTGNSLSDWSRRHFGSAVDDYLLNPAMAGIYAASPKELSVSALMPRLIPPSGTTMFLHLISLALSPAKKNSKKYGMQAPANGMESLVEGLSKVLIKKLGPRLRLGVEWRLDAFSKESLPPNLIITVPADALETQIRKVDPILASILSKIEYAPLVSCTVFAKVSDFKALPSGVGFLIPELEGANVLGVLFNSASFSDRVQDEQQFVSMTVMLGGTRNPEWIHKGDDEISAGIRVDLRRYLDWNGTELKIHFTRWPKAIPIYNSNLERFWSEAAAGWCSKPGRVFFGNYTGQVSIRGMIEVTRSLEA